MDAARPGPSDSSWRPGIRAPLPGDVHDAAVPHLAQPNNFKRRVQRFISVWIFQARASVGFTARRCRQVFRSSKLAPGADGGVGEIYEAVAVVDFYIEQDQHAEAEGAGDFGAERFADVVKAESDQALAILFQMSES